MSTYISDTNVSQQNGVQTNGHPKFINLNMFKRNGDNYNSPLPLDNSRERIAMNGNSQYDFLIQNGEKLSNATISEYVEVIFKGNIKSIYHNIKGFALNVKDYVVVETDTCCDIGIVETLGTKADLKQNKCNCHSNGSDESVYNLIRIPDEDDLKIYHKKLQEEKDVVETTKELIRSYNFDMKITEAHWQFDRQKLTIFFTAPMRIDFRELVKDLARNHKTRIELRQISAREEAKRLGCSVGGCGRETCCTSFLANFEHVTLEHARVQMLSNNVSKLSGNCGRLKCCIKFEFDTYVSAFEKIPPIGSVIEADEGIGKIIKVDIFKNIFTLYFDGLSKTMSFDIDTINRYAQQNRVFKPKEESKYFDQNLLELEG